jgi:hypothetical protein
MRTREITVNIGQVEDQKIMRRMLLCGLVCLGFAGAAQAAELITFESDTTGSKANGWSSVDSSLVSFSDSVGSGLYLDDFGTQGDGQSLEVGGDYDDSWLIMDFADAVSSLSLDFGNDDPDYSEAGDQAVLTAYLSGAQVGQVFVEMNRDDIMNQTISISGVTFDSATFYYDVYPSLGLIEIVDNIEFELADATVPAPGAILLGTLGTGLVGWLRRRRAM